MRFDGLFRLDLKLLVALQVLLEERSASRAAQRLHLSQSAVSKLLARLREQFDDPLFIRTPRGLEPTRRAEQLEPVLRSGLEGIQKIINPVTFDPASDKRHFVIASLGIAFQVLLSGFFSRIQTQAPRVIFDCLDWQKESINELANGRIELGVIARDKSDNPIWNPGRIPDTINQHILAVDKNVCLVRKGHPVLNVLSTENSWGLDLYLQLSHIQVCCEGESRWTLDFLLAKSGLERHLAVNVPDFNAALSIAEHSNLILTAPELFARQAEKRYNLTMLPLPVEIEPITYMLVWHQRYENELDHRWLRQAIISHVTGLIVNTP